ncbi:MAG: mycofactocin-associated electron transfer flavoprotein beta subunit [Actinomycetes bacterium]
MSNIDRASNPSSAIKAGLTIGVALKWVDLRSEVDPLTGVVSDVGHSMGCSAADQAALEHALLLAERWSAEVIAVCCGPVPSDLLLRDALAAGATRAVRCDLDPAASSEDIAAGLADVFRAVDLVCCGDYSTDRGSGSVPAFVAGHLGFVQALGLVQITAANQPLSLTAVRRLDGGRRELLAIDRPAVLSFEGSSATLRRASLSAMLATREKTIEVVPARPHGTSTHTRPAENVRLRRRLPYRPRAKVIEAPSPQLNVRERILDLTGALVERTPPRIVHATASEAADLVIEQLRAWNELA